MIKKIYVLIFLSVSVHAYLNSAQPTTLFCHGIINNGNQINNYQEFIEQPAATFDFPDAQIPQEFDLNTLVFKGCSLFKKPVNRNNMFMGTDQDITTLRKQIDPDKDYILYGFSRGGAAAINVLAQDNPSNIKALILESSPADMIDSIKNAQYALGYQFSTQRSGQEKLFHALFPAYQLGSTPPVKNIAKIQNRSLPILIIASVADQRVAIDASCKLYLAFLKAGFTDVYFQELATSKHDHYVSGSERTQYLQALHSFYKKYGFAYNPKFAVFDDLSHLQPSAESIIAKLRNFHVQQIAHFRSKQNSTTTGILAMIIAILLGTHAWQQYETSELSNHIETK